MIAKNISIYVYLIASLVAVIAIIFGNEWLMILSKPIIIPALFSYYLSVNKKKISLHLLLVLSIYFISDAVTLLEFKDSVLYIMILDFIPYLILLKVVVGDIFEMVFSKKSFIMSCIVLALLMFAMYHLVDLFIKTSPDFVIPVFAYGSILAFYVCSSLYYYLETSRESAFFMLVAAFFALIADVIFVVTNMVIKVVPLDYVEFTFQIISYFFIVVSFLKPRAHELSLNKIEI